MSTSSEVHVTRPPGEAPSEPRGGAPEVVLTYDAARAFYDRLGRLLDTQRFYEDHATDELIAHAAMAQATAVFEFGTGTGRLAARLLREHLPDSARYCGVDISSTMVSLARKRLAAWRDRAAVDRSEGPPHLVAEERRFDRFVTTYVLDLLASDDIRTLLGEAHRLLSDDGLLCLVSATHGRTPRERLVMGAAARLHALAPALVGGCRAIDAAAYLEPDRWRLVHRRVTSKWGIPSEVIVAAPRRTS